MELDYKAIGKRIKIQRIQREMTQEKLAELTGLSNPHISNVETGSTQVSLKSLIAIANALEITPDVLLCDNIRYGKHIFKNAVMEAVDDCDEVEKMCIRDRSAPGKNLRGSLNRCVKRDMPLTPGSWKNTWNA